MLAVVRLKGRAWWRLTAAVGVLLVGFLVLVTRDDPFLRDHLGAPGTWLWDHVPKKLTYVQYAYRLNTYVALLVCALVLLAVIALQRMEATAWRRALNLGLAAVLTWCVGNALIQVWDVPSKLPDRADLYSGSPRTLPPGWQDAGNFGDQSAPVVPRPAQAVGLTPKQAADDGTSPAPVPAGREALVTDVLGGPYLVKLHGLKPVGRTDTKQMVVRRSGDPKTPLTLSITHASTAPVVIGRLLTILALAALLAWATLSYARRDAGRGPRARARGVRRRRPRGAPASR